METSEPSDVDNEHVLDVAALLGSELDARLLAEVSATSLHAVLDLLDAHPAFTGPIGEWSHRDEDERRARIDALPGSRRMALHDQICDALIAAGGEPPLLASRAAAIADHAVSAVPIGADSRAAQWSIEAAIALADDEPDEARSRLDTAQHHAVNADDIELLVDVARARLDLWTTRRELRSLRREAATLATRAARLDRWDLAVELAAAASPGSAGIITSEHPDPSLTAVLREAAERADLDTRTRAVALSFAAVADYWAEAMSSLDGSTTLVEQRQLADAGVAAARSQTDPDVTLLALDHRIAAAWGPDMWPARSDDVTAMLDLALDGVSLDLEVAARGWRILELLEQWRLRLIEQEVHTVQRLSRDGGDPFHRWTVRKWRSMLALVAGRLDEATDLARRAHHDAQAAGIPRTEGQLFGTLGVVERLRGRADEASELAARNLPHVDLPPSWALTYAHACAVTGDTVRARQHLHNVIDAGLDAFPRNMTWLTSMYAAGHAAIALDEDELIREVSSRLQPYRGKVIAVGHAHATMGPVDLVLADMSRALGDDLAAASYRDAEALTPTGPFGALARLGRALVGDLAPEASRQLRTELAAFGMDGPLEALDRLSAGTAARDPQIEIGEITSRVSAGGDTVEVRSGVGLRHIARLVERAGSDLHVLELVALEEGRPGIVAEPGLEALDAEAVASLRRRLADIDAGMETADHRGDATRSTELAAERDAILEHLGRSTGRRGVRHTGGSSERARSAVTKAIRRAIEHLSTEAPELGAHLHRHIRTGATCSYDAPPDERWLVGWDA